MWFVKSMVPILMQLVDNCVPITMKRDRQKSSRSSQSLMMKKTYNPYFGLGSHFHKVFVSFPFCFTPQEHSPRGVELQVFSILDAWFSLTPFNFSGNWVREWHRTIMLASTKISLTVFFLFLWFSNSFISFQIWTQKSDLFQFSYKPRDWDVRS